MSSDNSASQMTPRFIRCTSCAWHGQDESLDPVPAHTLLCPACEQAECCDDEAARVARAPDLSRRDIAHLRPGLPSNVLGINGQHWINVETRLMYGPKARGQWPATGRPVAVFCPAGAVAVPLEDVRYV